jgi:hypothetical protein
MRSGNAAPKERHSSESTIDGERWQQQRNWICPPASVPKSKSEFVLSWWTSSKSKVKISRELL